MTGCRNPDGATDSTLLMFSCAQRCRRAEPLTFIADPAAESVLPRLRGIWLLAWSSRWLATMLWLLRRCTLES